MDTEKSKKVKTKKTTVDVTKEPAHKNKESKIMITIISLVLATLLILLGTYKLYFANSKRIISQAINHFADNVDNIFDLEQPYSGITGEDSFTMEGNAKINIQSDMLASLSTDESTKAIANLLNNLEKTTHYYTLKQDNQNKKVQINWNSKLDNKDLFAMNYIVQDDKQYVFMKNVFDKYISLGEYKYFDQLSKGEESVEELEYVFHLTVSALQNHLKDSYFTQEEVTTEINSKKQKVKKVSLVIDYNNAQELLTNVLNDLKNDKKAVEILSKYNSDFKNSTIKENPLGKEEKVFFHVYTDKLTYKELKYELEIMDSKDSIVLTYDKQSKTYELYYQEKLIGSASVLEEDKKTVITIFDANKKEIGKLDIQFNDKKLNMEGYIIIEDMKIQFSQSDVIAQENEDYQTDGSIKINVSSTKSQNLTLMEMNITYNNKVQKGATIQEKVTDSVPVESLSDTDKQKLEAEMNRIMLELIK